MGGVGDVAGWPNILLGRFVKLMSWLGIHPSEQDLIKAIILIVFVLLILMVLGDVYRGEIQNTLHRIRLIANPANDGTYKRALQVPKWVVEPTLDGVHSNAHFYYRYRDYRGRIRTKPLQTYRVQLRVRQAFPNNMAPGQEVFHRYSEEEMSRLARERPDMETSHRPVAEIVAMARSRVDYVKAQMERQLAREHQKWSQLETSWLHRRLRIVRKEQLKEPEEVGLVVKFHFPIDPYFLLYKHPDTNIRSTAWLTVLTSVFALFMQIVFSPQTNTAQATPIQQPAQITRAVQAGP